MSEVYRLDDGRVLVEVYVEGGIGVLVRDDAGDFSHLEIQPEAAKEIESAINQNSKAELRAAVGRALMRAGLPTTLRH